MRFFLLSILVFSLSKVFAAVEPVGPFNFGGGVNYQKSVIDLPDNQSPDQCNCVSNQDGSLSKISGTKRFIDQARSSFPVTGLYHAQASSGTGTRELTVAVMGPYVVVSTDKRFNSWITISSYVVPGQNWSFVTMNDKVIMTGDGLVNSVYSIDIFNPSLTDLFAAPAGSESVKIRAKYVLQKSNYLLFINCRDVTNGTTHYPSRVYFSLLAQPSSTTYNRFFDVRTNDGEELTGAGVNFDKVNLFKPSSIHELSFTILDLKSRLGDQELAEVVNGFGLKAPRSLVSDGIYYIFGAQDSIRIWDGGRRSRLNVAEESRGISGDIKTLIDKLIRAGTYERAIGKYYKKREWYVFAYEDPDKFPKKANNSAIVYDLRTAQWYPICGWNAGSFTSFDGDNEKGEFLYGDSTDSLVYYADLETESDNAPKQTPLDSMDASDKWTAQAGVLSRDFLNVIEGSSSLKVWVNSAFKISSMTTVRSFPLGSWNDKSIVNRDDKLQFKFLTASTENLTSLRIDLEVNDNVTAFDQHFTSFTFTDFTLLKSSQWHTMEVKLASFPVRPDWTDLDSEVVPFAGTLNFYGMRFVVEGVGVSSVTIDDVRLVQHYNPLNFYRFTKLFNSISYVGFGQILVTMEKPRDSTLKMDVYNDFGKKVNTISYDADIPKEIGVMGWVSTASITMLDDTDYSLIRSTQFQESDYLPLNGVMNNDYVYFADRTNNRLVKMSREPFGVIVSTYGEFGSGTTNFNLIHQIDLTEATNERKAGLFLVDMFNQRIKEHSPDNLSFTRMVGSLGTTATSYHQATGIQANNENVIVADEGNSRAVKLDISTLGVSGQKTIDYNTIGDTSVEEDENYYYFAYERTNPDNLHQDVFLEKRFKGNLDLVTRINVKAKDSVSLSTDALQGDIALRGRYVYVSFTNNSLDINPVFYLQKRLKSDFTLISEKIAPREIFTVLGDPFSYKPSIRNVPRDLKTRGKYVQVKFYDEGKDNHVRLLDHSYLVERETLTYEENN